MKKLLVTGGCGFIGSNFIHHLISTGNYEVINLDALTYAGNLENLADLEDNSGYSFVRGRIEDEELVSAIMKKVDAVVHFAAESHVDRSIHDASPFITTNVMGTQVLLDCFRRADRPEKFIHISTDEVYGSLGPDEPPFREEDPLRPNSPYAASKASSDLLVRASWKTYGTPVIITRCSNNYGPYQFPEKLIPLMSINVMEGRKLPLYGDGQNVRDWIHVSDHCEAIMQVLERGKPGEIYNLGGNCEMSNLQVIRTILGFLGSSESLIEYVDDRLGHDRRYAMDISKVGNCLGWSPSISFEQGIQDTIRWYEANRPWWERILSGAYKGYYLQHYGEQI